MAEIIVERIGGLAGVGLPGSRIRSRGRIDSEHLSAEDRAAVDRLFSGSGKKPKKNKTADAFRYRLSRSSGRTTESVEVNEESLPQVLAQSVKDELV